MAIQLPTLDWSQIKPDWSLPVQAMIAKGHDNAAIASKAMESVSNNYRTDSTERLGVAQQGLDQQKINVASQGQQLQAAAQMDQNDTANRQLTINDQNQKDQNQLMAAKIGIEDKNNDQNHVKDMLGLQLQADASHKLLSAQGQANENAAVQNFVELLKIGGADLGKLGLDKMNLTPELKEYATNQLERAMQAQKIGMKYGPTATGLAALGGNPKADMAKYEKSLDRGAEFDKTASKATTVLSQLGSLNNSMETFDANSMFGMGPAASASKVIAEVGDRLGNESSSKAEAASGIIDNAQGLAAIAYKNLVQGRVPASLSDAMKNMTPSIHDSLGTAKAKTNALMASQKELVEKSKFYKSYINQNGSDDGFDQAYEQYYTENPILDPKDPTKLNEKRQSWTTYLSPSNNPDLAELKFNGAAVSSDQIKYMASQTGMTPTQIISKYGLAK